MCSLEVSVCLSVILTTGEVSLKEHYKATIVVCSPDYSVVLYRILSTSTVTYFTCIV